MLQISTDSTIVNHADASEISDIACLITERDKVFIFIRKNSVRKCILEPRILLCSSKNYNATNNELVFFKCRLSGNNSVKKWPKVQASSRQLISSTGTSRVQQMRLTITRFLISILRYRAYITVVDRVVT